MAAITHSPMTHTSYEERAHERARRKERRNTLRGWSLSLPAVLVLIALTGIPAVTVIAGAFSADGLEAFGRIVRSPQFTRMLGNTAIWIAISLVGALVVGYLAAIALNHRRIRLAGVWRTLLLIPWITPSVAAATSWRWMFGTDFGTINGLLLRAGLIEQPIAWLTDTTLVLPALALVQVWSTFPFVMMMVTSGLQSIPDEVYEAAQIDGANPFQTLRHIILPALRDVTFILILIVTVWALNSFVPVWVITRGGPAGASTILPIELYQQFLHGTPASVSVIALFQLVISMSLAWFYVQRSQKGSR